MGNQLAAVVLAGGYSSRTDWFTPLLPLAGSTVLEQALAPLLAIGLEEVVVVVGHRQAELRPLVERTRARCVFNPHYDGGMYSSVFAGARALPPSVRGVFFLPADLPAVKRRTLALLARTWAQTRASVVYPAFRGRRGHPPLVSAALLPEILAGDGRGGLRRVLAAHEGRALEVGVLDEGVLLDVDSPAGYQRARRACLDRAVPTQAECEALLAALHANRGVVLHGRAVAKVATWLAAALARTGPPLDEPLLHAAGLLHDLAKGSPDHAQAGAALLGELGFPRVAALVAVHMSYQPEPGCPLTEAGLLYLADKQVRGERLASLEERFSHAQERLRGDPAALEAAGRRRAVAEALAAAVASRLGEAWLERLERDLSATPSSLQAAPTLEVPLG